MGEFPFFVVLVVLLIHGLTEFLLSSGLCVESERQALLKLKRSFEDPCGRLSSWQGRYCCQWEGIGCDSNTGHVTKLNLEDMSFICGVRAQELNSSLVELQHLNYLDLSGNDFNQTHIPSFLGSMKRLRFLGLSMAGFAGPIPPELGNLTALQHLDLRSSYWGGLRVNTFQWASGLLSLQYLDMFDVDMENVANMTMKVLSMLPSLTHLALSDCQLGDNIQYSAHNSVNSTSFTKLEYLDLSYNDLTPPSLSVLQNMTSLRLLDLSHNSFNSSIPSFLPSFKRLVHLHLWYSKFHSFENGAGLLSILDSMCSLKSLDLSHNSIKSKVLETNNNNISSRCAKYDLEFLDLQNNEFSGTLPDWLGKREFLKHLDLRSNEFYGAVPASIGKLTTLTYLDFSFNQLNGTIAESLGNLSSLEYLLDVSHNELSGTIPATLGDLSLLVGLDLSNNRLTGDVPTSLGKLTRLETLDISNNFLQGNVSEVHFANLSSLKGLSFGSNKLRCKISSDWIPPFSLNRIDMADCKVGSQFPKWLRTQDNITDLNLSNADIVGPFPTWLQDMPLLSLDLSMNRITGPFPSHFGTGVAISQLIGLFLGSNLMNGSIPKSLCKLHWLIAIDLSRNMFSAEIPDCLGDSRDLLLINLSKNELSGSIPISIGQLQSLKWFHINNNDLSGELPLAMGNCTSLRLANLGENQLSGVIPDWIGKNLLNLRLLRLRDNMFTGNIPRELCTLSELRTLDLANNHLVGRIPTCLGNLTGMTAKVDANEDYYDHWADEKVWVVIKGRALEYTTNLRFLVNMDLSNNQLQGSIPEELFALIELSGLNLSYNHLSGKIPNRIGNLASLESLDLSHNNLSGQIPSTLSELTMLAHLNLSYNNLSGRVPTGNQLQTLDVDPSIYAGNPQLCSDKLPNKCSEDTNDDSTSTSQEEDKSERIWFYFAITLGYATGLLGVIGTLSVKKSWRIAYFRFAENAKDQIIVFVAVNLARLKHKMINNTDD